MPSDIRELELACDKADAALLEAQFSHDVVTADELSKLPGTASAATRKSRAMSLDPNGARKVHELESLRTAVRLEYKYAQRDAADEAESELTRPLAGHEPGMRMEALRIASMVSLNGVETEELTLRADELLGWVTKYVDLDS